MKKEKDFIQAIFVLNTMWYTPFIGLRWIVYPFIYPEWLQSAEGNATATMFFIYALCIWIDKIYNKYNAVASIALIFFSVLCFINQAIYCIEDVASLVTHATWGDAFLTTLGFCFLLMYGNLTIRYSFQIESNKVTA